MPAKPDLSISAVEQRRQDPDFLARCAISAFAGRLPLPWPTPPATPVSPKPGYRSHYQPPDPNYLPGSDAQAWQRITLFDLILHLIDFSGLRPVLAAKLYRPSARGRYPFDPLSLFLLFGWQLLNGWNRLEALRHLTEERYADYAAAFGFLPGCYPTEGGLRYFLTTLGKDNLNALIVQSMNLIWQAGVIPEAVAHRATVSFDGMLHDAASRLRCSTVRETCYQPTTPQTPRPCPAKEKGQRGCTCETIPCQQICQHAPVRDPDARFVWYEGSNRSAHPNATGSAKATSAQAASGPQSPGGSPPPKPPQGEGHYGYRSLPERLIDAIQRTNWSLGIADLAAANTGEAPPAADLLRTTMPQYPWLEVWAAVGDAGLGLEPFLGTAYDLGVRRVVDLRADRSDRDKAGWAIRGYDDKGRPICQHGYQLHPNGYDEERRRSKWDCRQSCEESPSSAEMAANPPDCPYRDKESHPLGVIKNVGKTFADGSLRLVRDVPYGSPTWKELYRRARNAAEGRNALMQSWGLKRLPVFGTARVQATLGLAEVWGNLVNMARLVKEATVAEMALRGAAA